MSASSLLRAARLRAGLTQEQLADRAGLTQSTVARLESPGSNPTVAVFDRALRAAGATLTVMPLPALDETQIVARLQLTPAERLATFRASHRNLNRMTRKARRVARAT